jgi:hypothetical protein
MVESVLGLFPALVELVPLAVLELELDWHLVAGFARLAFRQLAALTQ